MWCAQAVSSCSHDTQDDLVFVALFCCHTECILSSLAYAAATADTVGTLVLAAEPRREAGVVPVAAAAPDTDARRGDDTSDIIPPDADARRGDDAAVFPETASATSGEATSTTDAEAFTLCEDPLRPSCGATWWGGSGTGLDAGASARAAASETKPGRMTSGPVACGEEEEEDGDERAVQV